MHVQTIKYTGHSTESQQDADQQALEQATEKERQHIISLQQVAYHTKEDPDTMQYMSIITIVIPVDGTQN